MAVSHDTGWMNVGPSMFEEVFPDARVTNSLRGNPAMSDCGSLIRTTSDYGLGVRN